MTYSIYPTWPGPALLTDAVILDTVPDGTTFVSAGQGGSTSTFVSASGSDGVDPGSPGSGTVDAAAVDDAWLNDGAQATNYGSATTMQVDQSGGGLGDGRSVVKFDLSGVPSGVTITGANLYLTEVGGDTSAEDVGAHQLTSDWSEGSVSWNSPSTTDRGDFDGTALASQSVAGIGQYTWSSAAMTTLVSNWYQGATANHGFILGIEGRGGEIKEFATKEAGAGPPMLEISYNGGVPSPATNCSIDVSPTSVVDGETVTVTMALSSDTLLTGVSPTTLTFSGANAAAALLTGPSPTSATVPGTGVPINFVWTYQIDVTSGSSQEFTFSGSAGNGGYTFVSAISNSAQVKADLGTTVTWGLGSNTAAEPGSDPGTAASSNSAVLISVADNEIWSEAPNDNYGGINAMWTGGAGDLDHSILRFDLSSIPTNATITAATMRLNRTNGAGGSVAAHRILTNWVENEATWNNRAAGIPWAIAGGDYDLAAEAVTAMGANGFYTWDLTSLVQEWVGGTANEGVLMKQSDEGVTGDNEFDTREDTTANNRPRLTVDYQVSARPATTTEITVNPVLVTDSGGGTVVTVSMTVAAGEAVTGITPSALTVLPGTNGSGATLVSGPTGSPANISAGGRDGHLHLGLQYHSRDSTR